ncbi:plasmid mobilization protein [Nocardia yamanashiensis]|uniref:plasmid mobilization protein n=1 Tax=Nocardia yamanashiensis TaxID=209247 RepID=UPI000A057B47|nr:plasmid mobilization relaxosome protein MobC [Nocardia yamanashiensis]
MSEDVTPQPEPRAVRMLSRNSASRNATRAERRRRTANSGDGPRTKAIKVKVSPAEDADLQELADLARVSTARLLREAALADELPVAPDEFRELIHELFRVQGALRKIGNNLNQIARVTNATRELGDQGAELAAVLAAVERYADRAGTAIEKVVSW